MAENKETKGIGFYGMFFVIILFLVDLKDPLIDFICQLDPQNIIQPTSRNYANESFKNTSLFVPDIFKENLNPSFDLQNCSPNLKFGFVKTHKTGSSTVQNIILRFGLYNNLNFILPKTGNKLSIAQKNCFNNVPWHQYMTQNQLYNIAALHGVWNYKEFSRLLGPKAVYFTILRNPGTAFESLYSYANLQQELKLTLPQFINSVHKKSKYFPKLNNQLQDLGLPAKQVQDKRGVDKLITEIDQRFGLVMIMEHMQESLVLLADLLCVPLFVVASLKLNARKPNEKIALSPYDSKTLIKLQSEEERLYIFFLNKFKSQIEIFGQARMNASVAELNRLNNIIQNTCVTGKGDKNSMNDAKYKPWTNKVEMWKVREEIKECPMLAMKEIALIDKVRKYQTKKWNKRLL